MGAFGRVLGRIWDDFLIWPRRKKVGGIGRKASSIFFEFKGFLKTTALADHGSFNVKKGVGQHRSLISNRSRRFGAAPPIQRLQFEIEEWLNSSFACG